MSIRGKKMLIKNSAVKLEKLNGIGKQKSEVPDTIKLYAGDL